MTGMRSAAVIVGEINAMPWASSSMTPRRFLLKAVCDMALRGVGQPFGRRRDRATMLRLWTPRTILTRSGGPPVHRPLVHALIEAIRLGRLAAGSALPGTRELGAILGVNREDDGPGL